MDHVLLCSGDLQHASIQVPYVCNARFRYDGLGFHNYPDRVGIDTNALIEDRLPLALRHSAPFLQVWLWFGILGEAFRLSSHEITAPNRASWRLFVKTLNNREYLCTNRLKDVLSYEIGSSSFFYNQWRMIRLASCIATATAFISKAQQAPFIRDININLAETAELPDVFLILLASSILCQTLTNGFDVSQQVGFGGPHVVLVSKLHSLELVNSLLIKAGWCRREIHRLPRDAVFRYYLTFQYHNFQKNFGKKLTRDGNRECQQVKTTGLSPQHIHAGCSCAFTTASALAIEAVIRKGRFPLFRFKKRESDTTCSLEICEVEPNVKILSSYVAISHVRMAGLGNDSANALPSCQLSLLQGLVDQLDSTTPNGTLFWIDTLCVPLNKHLRKTALKVSRKIFASASHVLVLDPPIYKHIFCCAQEALIRIRYSAWKRRVWTLEEGFLAKILVFRFSNRLITLDDLLTQLNQECAADRSSLMILRQNDIWPPLNFSSTLIDSALYELLGRLVDDIYVYFAKRESKGLTSSQQLDKFEVLKILRLGYLAASKFRYWTEDDECEGIQHVWIALLKIYGTDTKQAWGLDGDSEAETILCCLRQIATIESLDGNI